MISELQMRPLLEICFDPTIYQRTRYVELIAVMAKYSLFAEKAGMERVAIQEPSREVRKMASMLGELSFDVKLLGSQNYVQRRLKGLTGKQVEFLKACLARCAHPRFRKEFAISRHVPYGNPAEFRRCIRDSDELKLARLIRIVGMLLQTKVYLFWDGEDNPQRQTHSPQTKSMHNSSVTCSNSSTAPH
jgi:hypothetical protein